MNLKLNQLTKIVLVLLLTITPSANADIPAEVKSGLQLSGKWLATFYGMTSEEVVNNLGADFSKSTWIYNNKKEQVLTYQFKELKYSVSLYFHERKVVSATLLQHMVHKN